EATPLGPRRAVVSEGRRDSVARGEAAARREAPARARRLAGERRVARPLGGDRRQRPAADNLPFPVRPPRPRPRPGGGAVRILLPARDVRPESGASVWLLRAADPAG